MHIAIVAKYNKNYTEEFPAWFIRRIAKVVAMVGGRKIFLQENRLYLHVVL